MNWRGDEILHECVVRDEKAKVGVWIDLYRRNVMRTFGRSRKKISWVIYIETKAGRSFLSHAIQIWVPLVAFQHFKGCVVEDDSERIFLDPKTYETQAKRELSASYPKTDLALVGLDESQPGIEQTLGADSP